MSDFLSFSVDSALLKELGERLVGKPYVALAELIKNSYDADATKVTIEIEPQRNRIVVEDNGHGMSFDEFESFWMRIGSTHKESRLSRGFNRPMTGSKGVGRLSVQFLAHKLEMTTVSDRDSSTRLRAEVDWREAVKSRDLTKARVRYNIEHGSFSKGTGIILTKLKHTWDQERTQRLAREIWRLQPPINLGEDGGKSFSVEFKSSETGMEESFRRQMQGILSIWHARLVGKYDNGHAFAILTFSGEEEEKRLDWELGDYELSSCEFDIRIYHLKKRQKMGIRVDDAREYLLDFGGVYVYDSGFQLPYYGDPKNDWLRIEQDHAHRLSLSRLLPEHLQVPDGMTFLPTLSRVLGIVKVNTAKEKRLRISITRDRFIESKAFDDLQVVVRMAVDFYAVNEKIRQAQDSYRKTIHPEIEQTTLEIEEILERNRNRIPDDVYEQVWSRFVSLKNRFQDEVMQAKQIDILGPLATAGMATLAYQHELKKQFSLVEGIISRLEQTEEIDKRTVLESAAELKNWLARARSTNVMFDYFADQESREERARFRAKSVLDDIAVQLVRLSRGTEIRTGRIDSYLELPQASLAEWAAIFQNVIMNAFNAVLDSETRIIDVSSRQDGKKIQLLIQDTGCGVDLAEAERLFDPFERRIDISKERRGLGYGGTGLGLTIVRFIADRIGCKSTFVSPEEGFNTAFSLSWVET